MFYMTNEEIVAELFALEAEFKALEVPDANYAALCRKLVENSKKIEWCALNLNPVVTGGDRANIIATTQEARFATREQGLLLMNAARQLSGLSAQFMRISERMAALISTAEKLEQ
jgi:hypothetical protein